MTPSPRGESKMNTINKKRQNLCRIITEWEMDNWISQSQAARIRYAVANNNYLLPHDHLIRELRDAHEWHVQEVLNNAE